MINKDFGWIGNYDGRKKDIKVKMPKEICLDLIIGCSAIGIGIAFLVHNSFYRGANEFMNAEYNVMSDLDLFKN